jgi:uncharacterized protein DUF998
MTRVLLRVFAPLPLLAMLVLIVFGVFQPGYSSIAQHLSELEAIHGIAATATRVGALVSGFSVMVVGAALLLEKSSRLPFTAGATLIFGASIMSNGIFTVGSPLHGLHAVGLSIILAPAFFAAEFPNISGVTRSDRVSLFAATFILVYMWLLMTGLDPAATRGLTQRLAIFPMFGWFYYAGVRILNTRTTATVERSAVK